MGHQCEDPGATRRSSDLERDELHGDGGAQHHLVHSSEWAGRDERDADRHGLYGGHGGELQQHGGDDIDREFRHADQCHGADGGHHREDRGDQLSRDRDERDKLHGDSGAQHHLVHSSEWADRDERDADGHRLYRGHGGELQRHGGDDIHRELGHADQCHGADGSHHREGHGDELGGRGNQRDELYSDLFDLRYYHSSG